MGFSVSASAGIIFLAAFLAFGTIYTAGSNGYERVSGAHQTAADHALRRTNTAITIQNASYSGGTLSVTVTNNGTTSLGVNDTTVIADNAVVNGTRTVNGNAGTDLWLPGETLRVTTTLPARPSRVEVVTGNGVSVGGVV